MAQREAPRRRLEATALRARFAGSVLSPADEGYDEARAIWNGAIRKRPSLIARCRSSSDVAEGVRWAREQDVEISVRGGGHGVAGNALTDGGLVVDCSLPVRDDRRPLERF